MAVAPRDRLLDLLASTQINGIDFVEVRELEPARLYVHFLNTVDLTASPIDATITGGDRVPEVPVAPITAADWTEDFDGRWVLMLKVPGRGDFSTYTLTLTGAPALDPHTASVGFSFYAFCPSQVDCQIALPPCPAPDDPLPAIDYLAKDYDSFKQALSDFSAQHYPEWRERAEADLGMVLLEAFSAIGDDLSYLQDRIHQERAIDTATERRSLVRLARLVDYEPRPTTSATSLIQCTIAPATLTQIPAGVRVSAATADGSPIPFETGTGLLDTATYPVNSLWNALTPYWWDDGERCLGPGATSINVEGQGHALYDGQLLLIDTDDPTTGEPPVRELVTLLGDPVPMLDPLYGNPITRLTWRLDDALIQYHDLRVTTVRGNLVPVAQGEHFGEHFAVATPPASDPGMTVAIARLAANSTAALPNWQQLYCLHHAPIANLAATNPGTSATATVLPEIQLIQSGATPVEWQWVSSMLQAGPFEEKFTLDPMVWRPVLRGYAGLSWDYDGSDGATIRFGDGVFGAMPAGGDVFEVRYRVGRGIVGNVPVDTITNVDPAWAPVIVAATNPIAASGGADAETDDQIRRRAPYVFQNTTFRAVRPEDYNAAAQRLDWVQRAGTVFRWTGSWPTIFTTADPKNAGQITRDEQIQLLQLLNRYRLAGYETYAPQPVFVSLDIQIDVCAKVDAFRGDVTSGVRYALDPVRAPDGHIGFFHFDNFTLGTPFERSRLEAAIQAVPGIAGVNSIEYRRRGQSSTFIEMPGEIAFAPGEIFRLDNNASRPERGSYTLSVEGGK